MSDDPGSTPGEALRRMLTDGVPDDARRMVVRCAKCRNRLGEVIDCPYGPLWVGELRGRYGRRVRLQWGRPAESLVPVWLDDWRPSYYCDCDCKRNHAQGRELWRAWQAGWAKLELPVPPA